MKCPLPSFVFTPSYLQPLLLSQQHHVLVNDMLLSNLLLLGTTNPDQPRLGEGDGKFAVGSRGMRGREKTDFSLCPSRMAGS